MLRDVLLRQFPGLPVEAIAQFEAHYELLRRWNEKLNLIGRNDLEVAAERHYGESIFLARHLPAGALRIADIGSGAGFPGFPVAVLRTDCTVALVESHQRKGVFLREATRRLPNVRVLSQRAENLTERFDIAISRAVSYADLSRALLAHSPSPEWPRLAPKIFLLTGEEPPPESMGFFWDLPIALPWGQKRFLWRGAVSRETPCFT